VPHRVTLTKGFCLSVTPVTQEQWQAVTGSNPSYFKGERNLPVENVSWEDCQDFCQKLSQLTGKSFRLPTEAEWEYACRAGTATPFYFGVSISTDQANYDGNLTCAPGDKSRSRGKTTPVGSFPSNAWGLADMHGNVWEWCQDWHGPYDLAATEDPRGSNGGNGRVVRGGSWLNGRGSCRAAFRRKLIPAGRYNSVGCRLVLCLD
jgi:formylglycine-generating enzyme required for sulfatase activity